MYVLYCFRQSHGREKILNCLLRFLCLLNQSQENKEKTLRNKHTATKSASFSDEKEREREKETEKQNVLKQKSSSFVDN